MGKTSTFWLSAFIAIAFYIALIISFIFYIQKDRVKKYKTNTTQTVLEVNIVTQKTPTPKKQQTSKSVVKKVEKTIVKKSASQKTKKTTDLKSLFKDVNTKATKVVTKTVNKTKSNDVESRFKSKYQRDKKTQNIKLSKLVDVKNNESSSEKKKIQQNSIGENDRYFSMINDMILTRWYNYPLLNSNKYLVVVNVTIDTQGNFSYHIVSLSGIANVDSALKEFLNNQRVVRYPVSPDKKKKSIKINFKPDPNL